MQGNRGYVNRYFFYNPKTRNEKCGNNSAGGRRKKEKKEDNSKQEIFSNPKRNFSVKIGAERPRNCRRNRRKERLPEERRGVRE